MELSVLEDSTFLTPGIAINSVSVYAAFRGVILRGFSNTHEETTLADGHPLYGSWRRELHSLTSRGCTLLSPLYSKVCAPFRGVDFYVFTGC